VLPFAAPIDPRHLHRFQNLRQLRRNIGPALGDRRRCGRDDVRDLRADVLRPIVRVTISQRRPSRYWRRSWCSKTPSAYSCAFIASYRLGLSLRAMFARFPAALLLTNVDWPLAASRDAAENDVRSVTHAFTAAMP
jgi:hypothetical protein